MEDADLHDNASPLADVALVFSWATRRYFRDGRLDWSQELDGWSRVLLEEHIPFEIVVGRKRELRGRRGPIKIPDTAQRCVRERYLLRSNCKGSFEGVFAMEDAVEPEQAGGVFQKIVATGEVLANATLRPTRRAPSRGTGPGFMK